MTAGAPVRIGRLIWFSAYVLSLVLTAWGMSMVREKAIAEFSTDEYQAQWAQDRDKIAEQSASGPVKRDAPRSTEPPALIMMRDYFAPILISAFFFTSLMFGTLLLAVRAFRPSPEGETRRQGDKETRKLGG